MDPSRTNKLYTSINRQQSRGTVQFDEIASWCTQGGEQMERKDGEIGGKNED